MQDYINMLRVIKEYSSESVCVSMFPCFCMKTQKEIDLGT